MKGILIEKNGRKAIVMDPKGRFVKTKSKRDWSKGQEVRFTSPAARTAKVASVAAVFVLVLAMSFFGVYALNSYTVNMDVNPSMQIGVNAFNTVTSIKALNDDAEQIGDLDGLVGMKLGPAVNEAIAMLLDAGYLQEDGTVVLSIDGKNKVKTVVREVSEAVADATVESDEDTDEGDSNDNSMKIYVGRVTEEMANAAEDLGVPVGRIVLVEKAIEEGSTLDYESAPLLSIQEIQQIRNISKTINKVSGIVDGEDVNMNQFDALSRKLINEASRIEDEISALEETITGGGADDATTQRYALLQGQLDEILAKMDAMGVVADQETDELINGMAQMQGADKEEKERIREEIKVAKEADQDAKMEENRSRIEEKMAEVRDKVEMLKSAQGKASEMNEDNGNSGTSPGEQGNTGTEKGQDNGKGNGQGNGNN